MKIVLVAAIGENGAIGRQGALPWRLKTDMLHFKRLTIGKPVVMGRKTFESIGKALKGRTNIVITRDLSLVAPDVVLATSLDAAIGYARKDAEQRGVDEIIVIGGSAVFEATMPMAARLEITHVHSNAPGDVVFPRIDPKVWRETQRTEYLAGPHDEASFAVATYERRSARAG